MSPKICFLDTMNLLFNPFYRGEESFVSLMEPNKGETYDVKHVSKRYNLERRSSLF